MSIIKSIMYSIGIGNTIFMLGGIFFVEKDIKKMIISVMLMFLVMGVLAAIYQAKKISLLAQTLIHICGSYVAFMVTAHINKWFPFHFGAIITASVIFLAIFIIIWYIAYRSEKRLVESVNQHLAGL